MKTRAIGMLRAIGALALLVVLIRGIASALLFIGPAKDWVFETENGDHCDARLTLAFFGGLISWFWIVLKIKRAGMSQEEKRDSDRISNHGNEGDC
jgi:hypothetical protein